MVRIIEGHGFLMTRMPPLPFSTSCPVSGTIAGMMPGIGMVQDPGFGGVARGRGVIMCPPVSVCHQVSTIGQRPPPTVLKYHIQASGLIGSPTEPSSRRLARLYFFGRSLPALISERIAVGAV